MEIPFYMLEEKRHNIKVAFIHGRPSGHPIHAAYAKAVNADFFHEDRILRWQDVASASKIRRYISWILNAVFFPNKAYYSVYLCECMRVPQLIMKKLGLIGGNRKLIALMADESLYFLDQKKYPPLTCWLLEQFLNACDGIICIGDLQYDIAAKYYKKKTLYKIYNGIDKKQIERLNGIKNESNEVKKIIVIGNMAAYWRAWYKGVDIAISAFSKLNQRGLELHIIGEVDAAVKQALLKEVPKEIIAQIFFKGKVNDIKDVLKLADLCIHCSRGDAFPTSTLECFAAGVPVIVSEVTGTKSFVSEVDNQLVCRTNEQDLLRSLNYFLKLSQEERGVISNKLKSHPKLIDSEQAIERFREVFYNLINQ
jgi:glycosyltransferase involved in cell wall biosynthesis